MNRRECSSMELSPFRKSHNTQLQRTVTHDHARVAGAALPLCACAARDGLLGGR
jgi:hypothetical protein